MEEGIGEEREEGDEREEKKLVVKENPSSFLPFLLPHTGVT
ncbi:hypothetical protein DYBT9623_02558 [Dyadobacter sp. CECT 9623]|uniref:Uncharacterized protein n=1 Tax=Dyadobacter linearis TaxID=2823330 RepID=A0ABN7RCJ3_9BACT|nr:hypothetical protein DYBT9623_02558 [Dyadobacter sp. CECT 9623]